jgi:hypothetical protein
MLDSASVSKAGSTANSFAIGYHSHLPYQLDGHGESQRLVNVVKFPHDRIEVAILPLTIE